MGDRIGEGKKATAPQTSKLEIWRVDLNVACQEASPPPPTPGPRARKWA